MAATNFALLALLLLAGSMMAASNVIDQFTGSENLEVEEGAEGYGLGGGIVGAAKSKLAESVVGGIGSAIGLGGGASSEKSVVVPTKSQEKTASVAGAIAVAGAEKEAGFLGIGGPKDLIKLLLNPVEFVKHVAKHYKLHSVKLLELVSKGFSFGVELALQPALLTLKIIEKIFVPDACKLKLMCKMVKPFSVAKAVLPKLSSKFLGGSHIIKAISDGVHGIDCEATYSGCSAGGEPKLKKEYEVATVGVAASVSGEKVVGGHQHGGHQHGGHQHGGHEQGGHKQGGHEHGRF